MLQGGGREGRTRIPLLRFFSDVGDAPRGALAGALNAVRFLLRFRLFDISFVVNRATLYSVLTLAALATLGPVLAARFPHGDDDVNELPDEVEAPKSGG